MHVAPGRTAKTDRHAARCASSEARRRRTLTGCAAIAIPDDIGRCVPDSRSNPTRRQDDESSPDLFVAAARMLAAAHADITIGISLLLTGPDGLHPDGQPSLWPQSIAGEKLNVIAPDDATEDQGRPTPRSSSPKTTTSSLAGRWPSRWWPGRRRDAAVRLLAGGAAGPARTTDVPPAAGQTP